MTEQGPAKIILDVADILCRKLVAMSFVVHRYDSITTNSVYINLDYGMCNSIRISDHPGKARLAYRYNVDITRVSFEKMPYRNLDRYFYPVSFIDKLILDIKARRIERKSKYGEAAYFKRMSDFKDKSLTAKGFWAGATLITKESYLDKPRIVRLLGSDGKVIAELGSRQPGTKFVVTDIVLQDRTEDNMVIYNVYSCGEIIDAVGGYEITEISRPSSKQDAV